MALLSEPDATAWERLADRVAETVEPRLSPGVLANRSLAGPAARRAFPLAPTLRLARRAAGRLSARSDAVIRTDVRAFYPSVTPSVAFGTLVALHVEIDVARDTASMLVGWGSEGYEGLPIGPPGSAVLANAVLAGVDAELHRLPFLRWVDDYLIGLPEGSVTRTLERLDVALAARGLARSQEKTSILGGGTALTWPGTYRCR